MLLACSHISKSFGENVILSDLSFHVNENEKCAIVGINGVGKTTLLRMITGEEPIDSGEVLFSKGATIGYLKQQQDITSDRTIYEEVKTVKAEVFKLEEKIRDLELAMKSMQGDELDSTLATYHQCTTKYEQLDGYSCTSEITGIIKGLGFSEDQFSQTISTLSGGQKTRVALGKILLSSPDLIILDEPTNHLDMNSIAWLETYLTNYRGAVLIVSHDRYFIDKTVTKVVELDNGKGTMFKGNYSAYSEKKEQLRNAMLKAYYNQQKQIKHQEEVITKLKQFNREKSIKRAESREKMLDKIDRLDKPFEMNAEMKITFRPCKESGNDVLHAEDLAKSYGNNQLFSHLTFDIKKKEKIAIIGDNGTGKTTLLKILNEQERADCGQLSFGANVVVGYYDQEQQVLSFEKTVFDEIHDTYPTMTTTEIRNVLASFLFTGDDVFKRIQDLSGGEKGRVSLAKLMLSDSNFLILDEPTNHLDIVSKELLEHAINNYEGTVLYVSHDRYFVNKTATGILHLTEHHFNKYIGNYDYFLEKKDDVERAYTPSVDAVQMHAESESDSSSTKDDWLKNKELKAALRKAQSLLEKNENAIHETEQALEVIDSQLVDPDNAYNSSLLISLTKERGALEEQLEHLMSQWVTLSEDVETLQC